MNIINQIATDVPPIYPLPRENDVPLTAEELGKLFDKFYEDNTSYEIGKRLVGTRELNTQYDVILKFLYTFQSHLLDELDKDMTIEKSKKAYLVASYNDFFISIYKILNGMQHIYNSPNHKNVQKLLAKMAGTFKEIVLH